MTCVIRSTRRTSGPGGGVSDRRDRDVAHDHAGALPARVDQRQQPLRRAQRLDLHRPRRRHLSRHRRPTGSGSRPIATRSPRSRPAPRPIAPAGRTARVRRSLECRPGVGRPQVALAANSPVVLLRAATARRRPASSSSSRRPTRGPSELKNQGVRPRVFFGERWITSIFDLFEENGYFRRCSPRPRTRTRSRKARGRDRAGPRGAAAAQRHGLSVEPSHLRHRRWVPHLRVENRVLPAGPTIADVLANAAFYYGSHPGPGASGSAGLDQAQLLGGGGELRPGRQVRARRPLLLAGLGEIGADELILRHLLPMAHEGLEDWASAGGTRPLPGHRRGQVHIGGQWCRVAVRMRPAARGRWPRSAHRAARDVEAHADHMATNEPVHTWPLP